MQFFFLLLIMPFLYHMIRHSDQYTNGIPTLYLSAQHRNYLQKHFLFYQKLPSLSKKIFEKRLVAFMSSKKFVPRKMQKVTSEMKVLISASAIQLTFGFPKVKLGFFRYILVFPDAFYSQQNKKFHKGEVNPYKKAIVLSWKYFVEGYISQDGRNLGLHEMAHALRLENRIKNAKYNFLNGKVLQEWEQAASKTIKEIRTGTETFFRAYGATNAEEFFAVAVENFFERPSEFHARHPTTYITMCRLLRQDPLILERT
ncbi:MAG: zinc-dependent peptidase [Bacteroidota bacterium]